MNTDNLKSLLIKYDQKRNTAISNCRQKKFELYDKIPELEQIDNDINTLSIQSIKSILTTKDNKKSITELNKKITEMRRKRTQILRDNNLTDKDLEPVFDCKKCNDTGYIKTENGNVLCNCIKQELYNIEYNNANIYDLKNQTFKNFKLDYYSDIVDEERYGKATSPKENIASIKNICEEFIENFDDPLQSNLLFCGSPGLGKTFLSSCIANEMILRGKTVLYQTAPVMLDNIIDYKFGKIDNNVCNAINTVDLLIIDDLGTETKNSLKITELFNIINTRLLNQDNKITKTIISTNLSLQELYDVYEERIVSRIIGNYNACYFFGEDIRMKKKIKV